MTISSEFVSEMLSEVRYDFDADGRGKLTAGNIVHFYCQLGIAAPKEFFIETKYGEDGKTVRLDNLSVISFIRNNRRNIPHPFEGAFADRMERLICEYVDNYNVNETSRLNNVKSLLAGIYYLLGNDTELAERDQYMTELEGYLTCEDDRPLLDSNCDLYRVVLHQLYRTLCFRKPANTRAEPSARQTESDTQPKKYDVKGVDHKVIDNVSSAYGDVDHVISGIVSHRALIRVLSQEYELSVRMQSIPTLPPASRRTPQNGMMENFNLLRRGAPEHQRALRIYRSGVVQARKLISACLGSEYRLPHEEYETSELKGRKAMSMMLGDVLSCGEDDVDALMKKCFSHGEVDADDPCLYDPDRPADTQQRALLMCLLFWTSFDRSSSDEHGVMQLPSIAQHPHLREIVPQMLMWFGLMRVSRTAQSKVNAAIKDVQNELEGAEWKGVGMFDTNQPPQSSQTSNIFWLTWVLMESARLYGFDFRGESMILTRLHQNIYSRYSAMFLKKLITMPHVMLPDQNRRQEYSDLKYHYIRQNYRKLEPVNRSDKARDGAAASSDDDGLHSIFDLIPENNNERCLLLVSGAAGWGKSTLLQMLACCYAFKPYNAIFGRNARSAARSFLPLHVNIRDINTAYVSKPEEGGYFDSYLRFMLMRQAGKDNSIFNYNDCEDLLHYMFSHSSSRPEKQKPLLLIDGLEDFSGTADTGVTGADRRERFVSLLTKFVELHPECSCIVTATPDSTERSVLEDAGFTSVAPISFAKMQIKEYCLRWYEISGLGSRSSQEAGEYAERLATSYSTRWLMRRPLFLNYVLAARSLPKLSVNDESTYSLAKMLVEDMTSISDEHLGEDGDLCRCDRRDIIEPLSYVALKMFESRQVHLKLSEFSARLEEAREELRPYLSPSSHILKMNVGDFIDNILRKTMIVKFDRAVDNTKSKDSEPDRENFSFSSRPILWYLASKAIVGKYCDGAVDENEKNIGSEPMTLRGYVERLLNARLKEKIYGDDDLVNTIAFTAYAAGVRSTDMIKLLCEKVTLPLVEDRFTRITCSQILSHTIVLRPFVKTELLQEIYSKSFMRFFYLEQVDDVWGILMSHSRRDFLDYVTEGFRGTYLVHFPQYCWLIGYLDWIKLSKELREAAASECVSAETINDDRSVLSWLWNVCDGDADIKAGNAVDMLIDYLSDSDNAYETDESNGAQMLSEHYVRAALMLASFFWLKRVDSHSYRSRIQDDEIMLEDRIRITGELADKCKELFKRLIRFKDGCIADITCYTWSHIINCGSLPKDFNSEEGYELCARLVVTDWRARKPRVDLLSSKEEMLKLDTISRTLQPLCGAARLLCTISIDIPRRLENMSSIDTQLNRVFTEETEMNAEKMRGFYRDRYKDLIKLAENNRPTDLHDRSRCIDEGDAIRYAAMILRIGLMIGAWPRYGRPGVASASEVCSDFISRLKEARKQKDEIFLPDDHEEMIIGDIETIANMVPHSGNDSADGFEAEMIDNVQ